MHSSASTRRSVVAQPTRNVRAFSARPNRPVEVAVASPDAESVSAPPPAPIFVKEKKPQLNVIEKSAWVDGIPSVMGGHLMASGAIAPFSTSKGAGIDVPPHEFQYPDGEFACSLKIHGSPEDVSESLLALIRKASAEAIAKKGSFSIALPGGSVLNGLQALRTATDIDFSKWHVFFVDERNVPLSSSDSNYKAAMETFLGYVPIPYFNIRHLAEGLTVSQAATHYEGQLLGSPADVLPKNADGFPVFDCVILGMGADTHVASLFPNHNSTSEPSRWVVPVEDAHKAPAERISFSLPVINSAEHVALVVTGEEKAFAVQRVLELQSLPGAMPAQLVRPTTGELVWLLDEAAAGRLRITEWEDTETKSFPRTLMK